MEAGPPMALYFKKAKSKDPIAGMASIVAASMGAGTISEAPQIAQGIQETLGLGQAGLVSKDNTIPKAYINYLFFDKENTFKKGGYKQVSEAALGSFEELDLEYVPEEEGTMMIYTANQTAEPLDVYMDDLTILHTEGPIIRVDDYYPFGMTYHTSERTGYTTNKYLFNSKERQELTDWYDYGWRQYDPLIARWNSVDPIVELYYSFSPYSYSINNPIRFTDILGMGIDDTNDRDKYFDLGALENSNITNEGPWWENDKNHKRDRLFDSGRWYIDGNEGDDNSNKPTDLPEFNFSDWLNKLLFSLFTKEEGIRNEELPMDGLKAAEIADIVPDVIELGGGISAVQLAGWGAAGKFVWILKGEDGSFLPYVVVTGSLDAGVNIDAFVNGGIGYYIGPNGQVTAKDLEGVDFHFGGDVIYGGYVSVSVDEKKPTMITVGGSVSFYPSTSGGVGKSTILIGPNSLK
jgi:RHS repeat-associated protein